MNKSQYGAVEAVPFSESGAGMVTITRVVSVRIQAPREVIANAERVMREEGLDDGYIDRAIGKLYSINITLHSEKKRV